MVIMMLVTMLMLLLMLQNVEEGLLSDKIMCRLFKSLKTFLFIL